MKSYGSDLPNITKEEIDRNYDASMQAVDVSKATLAVAEESSAEVKTVVQRLRSLKTMIAINMVLILTNIGFTAGVYLYLVHDLVK